jgi:molybdopterin synthase catalytic subunit
MWTEILFFDSALPDSAPPPACTHGVAGAWAEFRGCVRADENGKRITALNYEIYDALARRQLEQHFAELAVRHGLVAGRLWHRRGLVPVGETAIYAAVAAPHRQEAFAALAALMDRLKTDVPIWKVDALAASAP